jgi:hypothetical protein
VKQGSETIPLLKTCKGAIATMRNNRWMARWMTWRLNGEDLEMNFGDRRRWIGKAIPLLRTCRGQTTDDTVEDAGVTHRMNPMDESLDDLMEGSRFDG